MRVNLSKFITSDLPGYNAYMVRSLDLSDTTPLHVGSTLVGKGLCDRIGEVLVNLETGEVSCDLETLTLPTSRRETFEEWEADWNTLLAGYEQSGWVNRTPNPTS